MTTRVFVTGIGLITAIGDTIEDNLRSMEAGITGLGEINHISTDNKGSIPVCEIRHTNDELKEISGVGEASEKSRTSILGLIAAQEAVRYAGLSTDDLATCGLISANSVGGMDRSEWFYPQYLENNKKGRLSEVKSHECGHSTEFISQQLGSGDFITTISTACSSSANAVALGARLIKHGHLDKVLVGGCDALTRFTINGFGSLKILDREGCRPFDQNRAGLNLGEGAGFLVLESQNSANARKAESICEVAGYANTCDAYHQTASSPDGEGSFQAMTKALALAGLQPNDIDYINAHGTGTGNNDLSEGIAIERLFTTSPPAVSSTKPFTGHTLGAAGGIEAVLCCLALRDNLLYPNLRWQTAMEELTFIPQQTFEKNKSIRNVLSNSFGFGGNDTSLVFSATD